MKVSESYCVLYFGLFFFFFFNDTATTEIYTLSLHDALPISGAARPGDGAGGSGRRQARDPERARRQRFPPNDPRAAAGGVPVPLYGPMGSGRGPEAVFLPPGGPRPGG